MADTGWTSGPAAPRRSTTGLVPAGADDSTAVRSRSRKAPANRDAPKTPSLTPGQSPVTSRGASPMPSARLGNSKTLTSGQSSPSNAAFSRGLLEGSWTPSWASVQDFASSLLDGGYTSEPSRPNSRNGNKTRPKSIWKGLGGSNTKSNMPSSSNWGPAPPKEPRPGAGDIAAGSLAERQAQLKARKTASVLESYEGVNGGLDVAGKYKRRNSDETPRSTGESVVEEQLVYLHHVQPTDTYAGIILRYRCQEHAFKKTNGLWSRDNIQIRKHLMIPVDACEVKGRPCDPPSQYSKRVDHLATTPQANDFASPSSSTPRPQQVLHDSYFESISGKSAEQPPDEEEPPWTHVRWVKLDWVQEPIEIVRVSRRSMGYFPPRRKKSIHTTSSFSTPRHSLELSKAITNSSEINDSPGRLSSRRQSSLSARPTAASLGNSSSARSRVTSLGEADSVPAWMRRPGGVGSMGRSVKSPGPAKDYFNTWVNKRLPGFNIDSMPSMSVMGSETAHFGFNNTTDEATGIVESPFEEGRNATSSARNGIGIEQAAASIETWLRGAWARRPSTPRLGSHRKQPEDLDLIELTDTNSDDGRLAGRATETGLLNQSFGNVGSTARSEGEGTMPICIECRHPVKTLWTQYSGAGDPSSGHSIRLTVYRHLLHNTLMRERDQFDPSIIRLGTLLLLFDVYLTWARIEKQAVPDSSSPTAGSNLGSLARQPIVCQYLFFLILCTFSTLAFHMSIRFLTSSPLSPLNFLGFLPTYPRPNSVSTALLVSSSTKLFPILMVIWDYDVPAAARSLGWAVVANNVEALKILLDCGYGVALVLASAGAVSRWLVGRAVLWVVGLEGVDSGGESGVAADGRALWALLVYVREWAGRLAVG
ncbi:carbohydrate-binding module family 50 protein [Jackrogersella minutella]|nr:carbohydrate-binding module family 50 protein [Jackrogersella minutella]